MFLKDFVYVNWGNIPAIECHYGPVNLFSGGNGSGKTTAADAIQTIMTAAHENLFQFNPGQDESTQRGRGGKSVRTLASYILGCDDGSYARLQQVDGYLAAVFHPTKGEPGEPFTAVIGVKAWLDCSGDRMTARQEELHFYIVKGEPLALHHFVRGNERKKVTIPLADIHNSFIEKFGKNSVEKYDTKKSYLRRLYGALRGKQDAVTEVEAVAAARAFSRFMAYKPVKDINSFVADEILEEKDFGDAIRSISGQLKTIHNMERDASQLVNSIQGLENAKNYSQNYIAHWIEINVLDYTLVKAEFEKSQETYLRGKQIQKTQTLARKETEDEIHVLQEKLDANHNKLISLEAQRQGVAALKHKDELENQQQVHNKVLVEQARMLLSKDQEIVNNIQTTSEIIHYLQTPALIKVFPEACDLQSLTLAGEVIDSSRNLIKEVDTLLQGDIATNDGALFIADLEKNLPKTRELQQTHHQWFTHWHEKTEQGESFRDQLSALVHGAKNRYQNLTAQRDHKNQEIERLNANQITYPNYVTRALKAIQQACPAADPRVLCDYIEVKDAGWQSAIEGYLGGARFSILVDEVFEADAINIVRGLTGRDNRAKVIQGEKSIEDADKISLPAASIVHVLEFTHAVAQAYVIASYGSVLQVDSTKTLRQTRRGITEEGIASGSYSMFRCDLPDSDLVFGVAARERALIAKKAELSQIEMDWHQANDELQQLSTLLQAVDSLLSSQYADLVSDVITTLSDVQQIADALIQLDLTEHRDLEDKLVQLKAQQDKISINKDRSNQKLGEITKSLIDSEKQIFVLVSLKEKQQLTVEEKMETLSVISSTWPDFNVNNRLSIADADVDTLNIEVSKNYREELNKLLSHSERMLADEVKKHNQNCRKIDSIEYTAFDGEYNARLFKSICDIQREIDRLFNILKNNILVEKHQQLGQLKDVFNGAFVTDLCHMIHQALKEGQRQIEHLNKELQHHQFGADRETFRFDSCWIAEYQDYARFFEELTKNPIIGDKVRLSDVEFSEKSKKVLKKLMSMLLDEDDARAMRDLNRIADYRNYRRYEIYKEVAGKASIPLSKYGTGSGGQLETPAYIIRAAAITSAFRFAEGNVHLRMVLVDEAFSKMDETRSREVINYLTKSLGLQLMFIMPTSKCGPFMDLISNEFVFAKVPSDTVRGQLNTRVLVDRKECNQEKIKNLWENHRRTIRHQAEMDFMDEVLA